MSAYVRDETDGTFVYVNNIITPQGENLVVCGGLNSSFLQTIQEKTRSQSTTNREFPWINCVENVVQFTQHDPYMLMD